MSNYIICPCCGKEIKISVIGNKILTSFISDDNKDINDAIIKNNIELANSSGGDDSG